MPLVAAKCTNCGASLQVDSSKEAAVCQYCGTPYITEKAIKYYNTTNNINANVVNIYGANSTDFEIQAGILIKYTGASADAVIPNTVRKIGDESFKELAGLTSVTIPDSVTEIGKSAFSDCTHLTTVTIPNSVTIIGESAFKGCKRLTNITIPNSVKVIRRSTFECCESLTNITIPNSITKIGDHAFSYCTELKDITIPESVDCLLKYAFSYCTSLESVTVIGNPTLEDNPFLGCSNLTHIYAPEDWKKRNRIKLSTVIGMPHCYVATCVYGSYDCPQVWTLRRYRDHTLAKTWYGRAFIRIYYTISPTIVKWFGKTNWFRKFWRGKLDRMVNNLNAKGVKSTPYQDRVL